MVVMHHTCSRAAGQVKTHGATLSCNATLQGLLKEKLELEPVRSKDGSKRVTIKRIEDELTFDKVQCLPVNSCAYLTTSAVVTSHC
jgi:hypothetical protein